MDNQQVQIFTSADGQAQLEVALVQDTVWLNQAQMAELFDKDVRTINEHIGNVFTDEELEREPTIRKFRIVRQEGKRQVQRDIEHYSLDVIISVGYRVKSPRGVQFRQWATRVLRQHLVEGYTLNQRQGNMRALVLDDALAAMAQLKTELIAKGEATELFGQLRGAGAASGRKPARTEGIDGAFD